MAALLHQAALPATKPPPHPLALNPTPSLSPLSRRRRAAATIRSAATDSSSIGAGAAAPAEEKKTTRKEKQHERRRQQDLQHRQQQLLMMEEKSSLAKTNGSSGSKSKDNSGSGDEDDEELPQPVFDRILRRILFAVGVPMASGVSLLKGYDALKREQGVDVPAWLPLLTILLAFGTSALGIAFGTLSASWDPDREGSLFGFDEVQTNWPVLWKEEIEKEKAKAKQRKK